MPSTIIDRMSGVADPAHVAVDIAMPKSINRHLTKCGIVPPAPGAFLNVKDVDTKLAAGRLSIEERIEVKELLVRAGLLKRGR